jgi:hypothetical protein
MAISLCKKLVFPFANPDTLIAAASVFLIAQLATRKVRANASLLVLQVKNFSIMDVLLHVPPVLNGKPMASAAPTVKNL